MWKYNYGLYPDEIYHHGIKGQKWGVRRYQNKDGTLTAAGKKRVAVQEAKAEYNRDKKEYNRSFNKAYGKAIAAYSPSKAQRKRNNDRWDKAYQDLDKMKTSKNKYKDVKKEAKKATKVEKAERAETNKNAVRKYSDAYDEWNRMADKHIDKLSDLQNQYRSLGENEYIRLHNVARNATPEAKKYNKEMEEWFKQNPIIDMKEKEIKSLYLDTGKTKVERVLNNMKYGVLR